MSKFVICGQIGDVISNLFYEDGGYMAVWIDLEHNFSQVSHVDIWRIGIKVLDALRRRCNRRLLFEKIGTSIRVDHTVGHLGSICNITSRRSAFWTPEEYGLKSLMLREGGEADLDLRPDQAEDCLLDDFFDFKKNQLTITIGFKRPSLTVWQASIRVDHTVGHGSNSLMLREGGEADLDLRPDRAGEADPGSNSLMLREGGEADLDLRPDRAEDCLLDDFYDFKKNQLTITIASIRVDHTVGHLGSICNITSRRSAFWTPEEYGLKSLMLREGGEADLDLRPDRAGEAGPD
ncbi:hypothetical protein BY996DRAFT_6477222 [Phakopsora pachyrhizi]|nr:hypothetical protein BY996DRAFT_6477222 [Phakopsora pachyrhizi]